MMVNVSECNFNRRLWDRGQSYIKTAVDGLGNENIIKIDFLDKGKLSSRDSIFVPNGTGAIGNTEIKVAGILDNQTVTLTVPKPNDDCQRDLGAGESGSYNFDASGDPNGVPATYGAGDIESVNYGSQPLG